MEHSNSLALYDGTISPLVMFSIVMAIMALFRVTFGTLHVLRMKCELSSKKFRIKHQNLKKVVNTMQGNLDESDYLLKDYLAQEERDQADDDLMATYSPLDLKIKKELAIKAQKEQMKKRKKGPDVSVIMDADNDDVEFSDAEAEEIQDVEEHEQKQLQAADLDESQFMNSFMASRKQAGFGAGRSSYVEKVLERSRAGADLKRRMSAAAKDQALAAGTAPGGSNDRVDGSGHNRPYLRPGKGNQDSQGGDQELVEIKVNK